MSVNKNIRCVEWFDTSHITPIGDRYVIGWYDDGIPRVVRLMGETWVFQSSGPGQLRQEFAKPEHWCEFPDGPGSPVEPSEPRMPLEHYRTENGKLRKAMADLMHKCPRCRAEAKDALSAMTRKAHHPRCELMQPHGHEPPKCTCPSENGEASQK